ncbi:MAG: futalosine hydrolase [Planctomycetia bacterium]|nr:futalosine hydrolase [Planctomycetia bacterium]
MRQHLLLVPTELERGIIEPVVAAGCGASVRVELCGFGPVVAAARTARLIAEHRPVGVLLVGIAGRLAERLAVGQAYVFDQVACHGVGAGSGASHTPAEAMGWPQWPGDGLDPTTQIRDSLSCTNGRLPAAADAARAGLLLSSCSASAGTDDVRSRLRLYPEAAAEDMEGFGVAAACRLGGVPLDIVRGISNTAGDRDTAGWQIDTACRAAAELAVMLLGGRS